MLKNWISNLSDHDEGRGGALPTGETEGGEPGAETSSSPAKRRSTSSSLDPSSPPPTTASAYYLKEEYKSQQKGHIHQHAIARGSQSSVISAASASSSFDPNVHIFTPSVPAGQADASVDSPSNASTYQAATSQGTPFTQGETSYREGQAQDGEEDVVSFHDEEQHDDAQFGFVQEHQQEREHEHQPPPQDVEVSSHYFTDGSPSDGAHNQGDDAMHEMDHQFVHPHTTVDSHTMQTTMETSVDESIDMAPMEEDNYVSSTARQDTGVERPATRYWPSNLSHVDSRGGPVVVETVSSEDIGAVHMYSMAGQDTGNPHSTENYGAVGVSSIPRLNTNPPFSFLGDDQQVPSELDRLKEHSVRTKETFLNHVHELECRLASLTAQLASETTEREDDLRHIKEKCIYRPFEDLYERFCLQRDAYQHSLEEGHNWMELEGKFSKLDAKMSQSVYVNLQDRKRQSLDSLHEDLEQTVSTQIPQLRSKVNKREGGMARQFDSLAGNMAKRYQEERAARVAAVEICAQDIKTYEDIDQKRADEFLDAIRQLRMKVAEEREARIAGDTENQLRLSQQSLHFRRVLLNLVEEPDEDPNPKLLLKG